MRTLITTLMASAMTVAAFQAANAADAVMDIPQAPAAEYTEPAISNWQGAYAGGTVTYQRGSFERQSGVDANGFGGGVYGGYNMQSGQIVYGGEADLNYSGIDSANAVRKADQDPARLDRRCRCRSLRDQQRHGARRIPLHRLRQQELQPQLRHG